MRRCTTIQCSSATIRRSHLHHLHSISSSSWHSLRLGPHQWAVGGGGGGGGGEGENLWLLRLEGIRHLDIQRYSSSLHDQEDLFPLLALLQ